MDLARHPTLWTAGLLSDADGRAKLGAAHAAFIEAGASIILSASYQTSPTMDAAAVAESVQLALDARDAASRPGVEAWVSVGPYGAVLADGSEYRGDYTLSEDELRAWHAERLSLLLSPHAAVSRATAAAVSRATAAAMPRQPDGLAFETIPSMAEVRAILSLLSDSTNSSAPRHGAEGERCPPDQLAAIPAWLSFSCRDGRHLVDGTPLEDAAAACASTFARRSAGGYIGVNCVPPSIIHAALDVLLVAAARAPRGAISGVVLYPNDGGRWDAERRCWVHAHGERSYAESLAVEWAARIHAAGLEAIIGGCCSTDQCTVRTLRHALMAPASAHGARL